jgi:anti-sigma28 factor (negative regulator of flagellin synthesis)
MISRAELESVIAAQRLHRKRKIVASGEVVSVDSYDSADFAVALGKLAESIVSEPYFRNGLVADLQRRISEGQYHVPADRIVERLIGMLRAQTQAG